MFITTTLSTRQFDHKPTKEEKKHISFHRQTIEVEQFYKYVSNGGAFCNIYDYTDTFEFKGKGSKINHYKGTQSINIDLDHQSATMDETFSRVHLKPTYCYSTSSNGLPNEDNVVEYSYRFIYIFDEVIYGKENYTILYNKICSQENLKFDTNAISPYQNMFGYKSSQSKFTGCIYSVEDFNFNPINSVIEDKKCKSNNITNNKQHNITGSAPFIDKDFYTDFNTENFDTLIEKYKGKLRNIQTSPIPYTDETEMMIELPSNFYEIRRLFRIDKEGKGLCKKIKYGQHRKNILYKNLMIRRLITNDLTPTELLYDLCFEMEYYIDNTNKEHKISREHLLNIVGSVMTANTEEFKTKYTRPRNRMVNFRYAKKNGMTKREVANKANAKRHHDKREDLFSLIGEYYDCSLTTKGNLKILKDYGINISIDTLKRFKKENGLTRSYKKNAERKDEKSTKNVTYIFSSEEIESILSPCYVKESVATEDTIQSDSIKTFTQTFASDIEESSKSISEKTNKNFKLSPKDTKFGFCSNDLDLGSIGIPSFFSKPVMKKKPKSIVKTYVPLKKSQNSLF